MSLQLDSRQRAMLQEMGITIWQPAERVRPPERPPLAAPVSAPVTAHVAAAPAVVPAPSAVPAQQPVAPPPRDTVRTPTPSMPVPTVAPAQTGTGAQVRLHAPQLLYPGVDANSTPVGLGAGWLVVFETPTPGTPFAGDTGKLLDNMLRAMQLHRHPRTFAAVIERASAGGAMADAEPVVPALEQMLAEIQPAMVLILGLGAARAILESREPLGRLRAALHQLPGGTPAMVSYDPAYLLRAPDAKAAAWADLCRALALVRNAAPT